MRLPTHLEPTSYTLFLIPFLVPDNFTIAGHVDIEISVVESADNITVHIFDMVIHEDSVMVTDSDGRDITVTGDRTQQSTEWQSSVPCKYLS